MSMKEIAEITGLSIATVSHALNGTRAVSAKSRKLVQQAAEQTGYKPSLAAQILRTQKSGIVALIIPSSHPTNDTNSFYFGVLNGAKESLEKQGYDMIVSTYPETATNVNLADMRVLGTRMVDGVLLVPCSNVRSSLDSLSTIDIPIVLLDRVVEGSELPTVKSDNFHVALQSTQLLITSGKKRLAFLGGKLRYSTVVERLAGYKKALANNRIEYNKNFVITELTDQESQGYDAAKMLVSLGADAVFVENSTLIIGIVNYCKQYGLKIPEDLAICGFDNAPWMDITTPPITAVQQDAETIGELGAKMLLDFIEGNKVAEKNLLIPAKIVKRESHK